MKYIIIIIAFISTTFLSCKEQAEVETVQIGKTVSELDAKIWYVFQDTQENYWFGSNGKGIYHLDGKELKQITTQDGLISNTIRGIQEDKNGNIFIETPKGISKFDGKIFTTLKVEKSPTDQWKLEPNDLWFNCNGNANDVYRFDGEHLYELKLPKKDLKSTFGINEQEVSYSPYSVFGIDKDKSGNVWFGTILAGAFRFDGKSFLWVAEKELSRLEDGREPGVRSILEDKDGNIWLSNFKSKYTIKPYSKIGYEKLKAVDLSAEIVNNKILYFNAGLSDKQGNLWMTTYGGGVWKYNGKKLTNFEIKNGEEEVLLISIYQDNNGIIWLGTDNAGAYRYNGKAFEKFELKK